MVECGAVDLIGYKKIRKFPEARAALEEMSDAGLSLDAVPAQIMLWLQGLAKFHVKLVDSAGNSRLTYFYQSISSNMARYTFLYGSLPGMGRQSLEEHEEILEMIERARYDPAREKLRSHILSYINSPIIELMEEKISRKLSYQPGKR
jgi:DNA-binding GntR family transcriptional regulator